MLNTSQLATQGILFSSDDARTIENCSLLSMKAIHAWMHRICSIYLLPHSAITRLVLLQICCYTQLLNTSQLAMQQGIFFSHMVRYVRYY